MPTNPALASRPRSPRSHWSHGWRTPASIAKRTAQGEGHETPHFRGEESRPRHCARTTIAPTGTIALAAGLQCATDDLTRGRLHVVLGEVLWSEVAGEPRHHFERGEALLADDAP